MSEVNEGDYMNAEAAARTAAELIEEEMDLLEEAEKEGEVFVPEYDEVVERCALVEFIREGVLSVEVRSGWHTPGEDSYSDEYRIMLGWGGPAVQIRGQLGRFSEPETAELECQDWFLPWKKVEIPEYQEQALLKYARLFYYGE